MAHEELLPEHVAEEDQKGDENHEQHPSHNPPNGPSRRRLANDRISITICSKTEVVGHEV
jgi:hypothetical protein